MGGSGHYNPPREFPDLAAKGLKNTGRDNDGGPVVTAGGRSWRFLCAKSLAGSVETHIVAAWWLVAAAPARSCSALARR
jgi:hypothetical protein